ncbi:MAG: Gx transporter family protein [Clostridium sp.]|nr:Gx transporter family protein [Clostridium sp.]
MSTKKIALYGLLIALAVVLGYVESLVPVYLGAPGVKLGLANLVTMISLYCMGVKETIVINGVRILFTGFTFGPPSTILFGAAGAALSLFVMYVCKKYKLFGMVGVSILGGVAHNVGQFLMASFVVHTFGVFSYLPVLLAAGTAAGAMVGLLGGMIVVRVGRIFKNI